MEHGCSGGMELKLVVNFWGRGEGTEAGLENGRIVWRVVTGGGSA
jgi:hypothetical protein